MGKKVKVGKQRKDKFYHLAKDAGFRSRAAFKLLQLNRKFEFLGRSRVLVDLCAAPGGWLQVAQKYMPVSSVIVGVDLVPIKPIPNVVTLTEDITTNKCRQQLKRELKTWKADVVLHDGAPNVGKSWLHDAFAQAQLTLHAFKLASELLVKGGWFVTKVFRSKDYNALLWVFSKLFKKVHATKPQASRNESAEIFVVCQHFLGHEKVDPAYFDIGQVFKDTEPEVKPRLKLFGKEKTKVKADGYAEGDNTLYHRVPASEFIHTNRHMEMLASCSEIFMDNEEISNNKLTTKEIVECCKDIKVLGRKELKELLQWKRDLKKVLDKITQLESNEKVLEKEKSEVVTIEEDDEKGISYEERRQKEEERRKKKAMLKEKRKKKMKLELKMVIKDDVPIIEEDMELFRLSNIRKKKEIAEIEEQSPEVIEGDDKAESEEEANPKKKRKYSVYNKDETIEDWCTEYTPKGDDSDDEFSDDGIRVDKFSGTDEDSSDEEYEDIDDPNPLIVDIDNAEVIRKRKTSMWFDKSTFEDELDKESDEDLELDMMADVQQKIANAKQVAEELPKQNDDEAYESEEDAETSDSSSSEEEKEKIPKKKRKRIRLDPEGMALGTLMVQSGKAKRDIVDQAHNRYTFNDVNLPDWFIKDESKHNKPFLPVTHEMVQEYKDQLKEINARPIKKVAEAKARKKKRALRKMEKARKRAEKITENEDMTDHEKAQHIKTVYKKALKAEDKKVTYVFPKKGIGRKVRRPPGVKGKFKVVDKRMKKDDRIRKTTQKNKGKTTGQRRKKRGGR